MNSNSIPPCKYRSNFNKKGLYKQFNIISNRLDITIIPKINVGYLEQYTSSIANKSFFMYLYGIQ
jgi:hypothetical protein